MRALADAHGDRGGASCEAALPPDVRRPSSDAHSSGTECPPHDPCSSTRLAPGRRCVGSCARTHAAPRQHGSKPPPIAAVHAAPARVWRRQQLHIWRSQVGALTLRRLDACPAPAVCRATRRHWRRRHWRRRWHRRQRLWRSTRLVRAVPGRRGVGSCARTHAAPRQHGSKPPPIAAVHAAPARVWTREPSGLGSGKHAVTI